MFYLINQDILKYFQKAIYYGNIFNLLNVAKIQVEEDIKKL